VQNLNCLHPYTLVYLFNVFMTWSFHLGSITLQMQAIPSVMLSWCHSMVFGITFGVGKQWFAVCYVHGLIFYALSELLDRPQIIKSLQHGLNRPPRPVQAHAGNRDEVALGRNGDVDRAGRLVGEAHAVRRRSGS